MNILTPAQQQRLYELFGEDATVHPHPSGAVLVDYPGGQTLFRTLEELQEALR